MYSDLRVYIMNIKISAHSLFTITLFLEIRDENNSQPLVKIRYVAVHSTQQSVLPGQEICMCLQQPNYHHM